MSWLSPYRWLLYGALAVALVAGYFAWADHIGDKREAQVVARYQKQADDANAKRAAVSADIAPKAEAAQERIRTITNTIIKKVNVYVKADSCALSGGFRVYHDAAADGVLPDPARIPDAAAAPAQDVASTVSANYGTYHETAQRLIDLQGWVRSQQQIK